MSAPSDGLTPERYAAWERYYRARIDTLSAGALVAALVNAYEKLEKVRSAQSGFCDADANVLEQILTEDAG